MKIHLVLFGLLGLVLGACSSEAPPPAKTSERTGQQLFQGQQCILCHGPTGQGQPGMGPDLRGVGAHWNADSLMEYLQNPKSYAEKDERLQANQGKYRMPMPNCNLADGDLRKLAEHVLAIE